MSGRDHITVLEALDESGRKYRIRVLRAGLSQNRNYYPDATLQQAIADRVFEGLRVFVKSDEEHVKARGRDVRNLVGRVTEAVFVPGANPDQGEIQAVLELLASAGEIAAKVYEAVKAGMHDDLFGLSIDAGVRAKRARGGIQRIERFTKVNSLDLIVEPSAGGGIINIIEAVIDEEQADMALRTQIIESIKKAHGGELPQGLDIEDEAQVLEAYQASLKPHNPNREKSQDASQASDGGRETPSSEAGAVETGVTEAQLDARFRVMEARTEARSAIAASKLPEQAQKRLREHFDGLSDFTAEQVTEAIKAERDYLASVTEGGHVRGLGDARIEAGEDRSEKIAKMWDDFFDPTQRRRSVKECYIETTGDKRVTGHVRECDERRLREAMGEARIAEAVDTSTFANVLGDAITRRMIAEYAQPPGRYASWRALANVVSVGDFRTNERTRMGGYGDLPAVAQGAPYAPLTTPSDEKATYAVSKRGGTEELTLEAIKNDDVGALQRIPMKLTRSAQRTLAKFALDFIKDNPVIYDTDNLFHANHSNLGSSALDATTLAAARLAMLKQTEAGSLERLGIPPVHLWVSSDLEETAFNLFRKTTNNDEDFVESMQMMVHPVWYWTDANDWAVTADVNEIPFLEIAFLDGQEEPELFVQDNPTVGSLFSHDKITYKIRHIYGGNVVEYRGAYKAVVT